MSEAAPKISVVMPLYNKEREVTRAINSVLAQTYGDYELLVVDDGSTDGGPAIVSAYSDKRIRLIRQANAGVSAARNRGIAEARAGLVAFLDADDEWEGKFIETVIHLRDNFPSCDVFATSYLLQDAGGVSRSAVLNGISNSSWEGIIDDYFMLASISDPPLCSSAIAVKKSAIAAIGGFPVGIKSGEDLLTWARLALRYRIAYSAYRGAIFWMPEDVYNRPGRFIDIDEDVVGKELEKMLANAPHEYAPGMRRYIGRWHEMRAIIALQLNRRGQCRQEIRNMLRYSQPTIKLAAVFILSCLPGSFPSQAYKWLKRVIHHRGIRDGVQHGTP